MFDFLKYYAGYEVGTRIGSKLPGAVKAICKGFALVLSIVIWTSDIFAGSSTFWQDIGAGGKAMLIIYCILVWGSIVGLMVLKVWKNVNTFMNVKVFTIYHWALLVLSIAAGIIAMGTENALSIIFGVVFGFFFTMFPEFIYILADSLISKILKMKRGA